MRNDDGDGEDNALIMNNADDVDVDEEDDLLQDDDDENVVLRQNQRSDSSRIVMGILLGIALMTVEYVVLQLRSSRAGDIDHDPRVPLFPDEASGYDDDNDNNNGNNNNNNPNNNYHYPDKLYGHVHMAKTAGTTLNGELAARYERVCGHKGYSYDFYRSNNRTRAAEGASSSSFPADSFSKLKAGFNRGRVPPNVMREIGFEGARLPVADARDAWVFPNWPHTIVPVFLLLFSFVGVSF